MTHDRLPAWGNVSQEEETYTNHVLCLALDIGEGLLKSGAEVHRVENTIERVCRAYGAVHVEVFAISSLIMASVRMEDHSYSSQLRRVYSSDNRLTDLERFNSISRRVCADPPPLEELEEMIRKAKQKRGYPLWISLLGGAMTTAFFALLFGGSPRDALASLILGVLVVLINRIPSSFINKLAKLMIISFIFGSFAYISVFVGLGEHVDIIAIATIMLLIPGLAFGNSLRDLLCGDILAGLLKTVQSCLSAVLIAFGYMLAALLMEQVGLTRTVFVGEASWTVQLISAIFGTLGFALVFQIRLKPMHLISISACGFFTYLVYLLCMYAGLSVFLAAFFATAFTAIFAEVGARIMRAPALVFSIPGAISIVPGSGLYYTMNALLFGEGNALYGRALETLLISIGMALGMVMVSVLTTGITRFLQRKRQKRLT